MRLTNQIRDAFINGAMGDVPKVDYTDQIRKTINQDIISQLPETVKVVFDNPETTGFIETSYGSFGYSVHTAFPKNKHKDAILTKKARTKLDELKVLRDEQDKRIQDLRNKLKAAAYACTTRKALVELLPEFEKYLPADTAKAVTNNLPAVANILSDFVKAGWPKNQKRITI